MLFLSEDRKSETERLKMKKTFLILTGIILITMGFLLMNPASGDASSQNSADTADEFLINTLNTLLQNSVEISHQIEEKKHARKIAFSEQEKAYLSSEISQLSAKLEKLETDFESVALGIDMNAFHAKPQKKFVWKDEVHKLIDPLITTLKRITARPRQIEMLRNEIGRYEEQLEIARAALENLATLLPKMGSSERRLEKRLLAVTDAWWEKERQISDQLAVSRFQLDELSKERQSIWESSQNIIRSFFRSRGRNLILSVLAFGLVFAGLRYSYRLVYKFSPIHKAGERNIYVRVMDVLYHLLTIVGATGAMLSVLYVSGDWMLLSCAIIFLLGMSWTAKEGLPLYWRQVQLMLNLGTVRENERIVYLGIPWKVASLSFFTTLENPALTTGVFRVPLKEMIGLNSRPCKDNEPWFPSERGDWVILSDRTRGRVVSQTPEMVQLVLRGGSKKTYTTRDFLSLTPLNISENFRLKIIFGLAYDHQAIIISKIPEKLGAALRQGLRAAGYGKELIQAKVEIEAAGASSIDLAIIADFSGEVAALYNALKRLIQKLTIEACTQNKWEIPFAQLVIRNADSE